MSLKEKLKTSAGKLDKKSLVAFSGILFVAFGMVAVPAASQIQLYNGAQVKLNGGDIVDGGTTVWDSSTGQVPSAAINAAGLTWTDLGISQSDVSANDVGLGNVENIALSNAVWSDLGIARTDISPSDVGTTASDVGLGSVENEAQVAESGDTMSGDLIMNDEIRMGQNGITFDEDGSGTSTEITSFGDGEIYIKALKGSLSNIELSANNDVTITPNQGQSNSNCDFNLDSNDDARLECPGTKNWVHDLGNGSEAVYTSQESPGVRAVYEGQTTISNEAVNVSLPDHFSMTVSDSDPMLRAQATPHELATVAVTERTDDYLVIESSKDVKVDYRITGIREGYEDKQVVRPKEE